MQSSLTQLAISQFGVLQDCETRMLDQLQRGEFDASKKGTSHAQTIVRSGLIRWLCVNGEARSLIGPKGVSLKGVTILGDLDLSFVETDCSLRLLSCGFLETIDLSYADFPVIELSDSSTKDLFCDALKTRGDLSLENLRTRGRLSLVQARIGGDLNCAGARLQSTKDRDGRIALLGDGIRVEGSIYLSDKFRAVGDVQLIGAQIGLHMDCSGGRFSSRTDALTLDGANVGGSIILSDEFEAHGEVRLLGAKVGLSLDCENGSFKASKKHALSADGIEVREDVLLCGGFKAIGEVRLPGANIGGDLYADDGSFQPLKGRTTALSMEVAKVRGTIALDRGFTANGTVCLTGAEIGADLDCRNAKVLLKEDVEDQEDSAIEAAGIVVHGDVIFTTEESDKSPSAKFQVRGGVELAGADISGSLWCDGGLFEGRTDSEAPENATPAIRADGIRVQRDVLLTDCFCAVGEIRLVGVQIGGALEITEADLTKAILRLDHSHVQTLRLDAGSWPTKGNLSVDGFVYDRLSHNDHFDRWLEWLDLQLPDENPDSQLPELDDQNQGPASERLEPKDGPGPPTPSASRFNPSSYRQLATILKQQGEESQATDVLIAMEEHRRLLGNLPRLARVWALLMHLFLDHGYSPSRAIWFILVFVAVGYVLYGSAYQAHGFAPTKAGTKSSISTGQSSKQPQGTSGQVSTTPEGTPQLDPNAEVPSEPFCAMVYSVDTLVPIVNLGQREAWHPIPSANGVLNPDNKGILWRTLCDADFLHLVSADNLGFVVAFRWLDIGAGWFLTTLLLAAVAKLVRKD